MLDVIMFIAGLGLMAVTVVLGWDLVREIRELRQARRIMDRVRGL